MGDNPRPYQTQLSNIFKYIIYIHIYVYIYNYIDKLIWSIASISHPESPAFARWQSASCWQTLRPEQQPEPRTAVFKDHFTGWNLLKIPWLILFSHLHMCQSQEWETYQTRMKIQLNYLECQLLNSLIFTHFYAWVPTVKNVRLWCLERDKTIGPKIPAIAGSVSMHMHWLVRRDCTVFPNTNGCSLEFGSSPKPKNPRGTRELFTYQRDRHPAGSRYHGGANPILQKNGTPRPNRRNHLVL